MNLPAPTEGFTPLREMEAEGAKTEFCWCYACGAALVVDADDLFDPFEVHRRWHEKMEARS